MWLTLLVVRERRRAGQSLGVGEDPRLLRAVRRHANFAENTAIFIVCLGFLETLGGPKPLVAALAVIFLIGRGLHAIGLSLEKTSNAFRIMGVFATVASAVFLGFRLIGISAGALLR